MAVGFTAGLSSNEHSWVASYFSRFSLTNPIKVPVTSVTQVLPATFKALLEAVLKTADPNVVIVAHGYDNGRGLLLPLVAGKVDVTHDQLFKLTAIAKKAPLDVSPADEKALGLKTVEILDLVNLTIDLKKRKPPLTLVEFRGCYLGRNTISLGQFREFFGAMKMGAPKIGGFFGLFPHQHGAFVMANHQTHHVGTTYSYPESFTSGGRCICCIGVDNQNEPATGHLVADTPIALQSWVDKSFSPGASGVPTGDLPVHFLFDKKPALPPGVPAGAGTLSPEAYFPVSKEYAGQITYSP